jgi:hypothetical protein
VKIVETIKKEEIKDKLFWFSWYPSRARDPFA